MNRKTRILAGCLAAVLSALNLANVSAQSSASQSVTINIPPIRALYVNGKNQIFGIQSWLRNGEEPFPESEIEVYRNRVEIPMTSDIRLQYYFLLNPEIAERAGINWGNRGYWYHNIDASVWDSYQTEAAAPASFFSSGLSAGCFWVV